MAKGKATQRKPPKLVKPQADPFKRFHIAVALAPVFAREYLNGKIALDHEDVADAVVHLANAIARRLDKP